MSRCLWKRITGLTLFLALVFTSPSDASHETILIDGDLDDLIQAVNANLGGSNGGLKMSSTAGDIYSQSCAFVNGFDLRNTYALFDFKDSNGDYTPNDITLYLGWETEGTIGDVDGDNNASTYTAIANFTCANNGDLPGIGPSEAYKIFIDANCDFITDVTICITDNQVVLDGVGPIASATFARDGKFLEVKVPGLQDLLPPDSDLCNASVIMSAFSQFDGLGEDNSPKVSLAVPPQIEVSKNPALQSVCVGTDVSWTIVVKNPGLCTLSFVGVADTLETGMTFVSSDPASTGDDQNRSWNFQDLASGDSIEISLTATMVGPCAEPLENRVTAEGLAFTCDVEPVSVLDNAVALVSCDVPNVTIDKSLSTHNINSDGSVTVTLLITNTGSTILDPVQVCDQLDSKTTIDVGQTPGGTCGVGFDLLNGLNNHICFEDFSLDPRESCTITYVVGCGEQGTHGDTATVTAYCAGTYPNNPVTAEDKDSFVCQDRNGFACPHTIGFWRQQCAQKTGGSTKVCLEGMENLWRCVINTTGVNQWTKNDGTTQTTASLAALSDENLFAALCSQLQGPRPMTIRDMTEIQYLGLMLNVCAGALPLDVVYAGGSADMTIGEAIASIEAALNTGVDLDKWKTVADNINNRLDLLAEDCPEGDDLFRNVEGCNVPDAPNSFPTGSDRSDLLETRVYPNPIVGGSTSIFYRVPAGSGASEVEITVFDLSGRAVRKLVSGLQNPGDHSTEWNLTDDAGSSVSAGIYFYRVSVGGEVVTRKMMVLTR